MADAATAKTATVTRLKTGDPLLRHKTYRDYLKNKLKQFFVDDEEGHAEELDVALAEFGDGETLSSIMAQTKWMTEALDVYQAMAEQEAKKEAEEEAEKLAEEAAKQAAN